MWLSTHLYKKSSINLGTQSYKQQVFYSTQGMSKWQNRAMQIPSTSPLWWYKKKKSSRLKDLLVSLNVLDFGEPKNSFFLVSWEVTFLWKNLNILQYANTKEKIMTLSMKIWKLSVRTNVLKKYDTVATRKLYR